MNKKDQEKFLKLSVLPISTSLGNKHKTTKTFHHNNLFGATTLSIMADHIMTFSIMTYYTMTYYIMSCQIMTFRIVEII